MRLTELIAQEVVVSGTKTLKLNLCTQYVAQVRFAFTIHPSYSPNIELHPQKVSSLLNFPTYGSPSVLKCLLGRKRRAESCSAAPDRMMTTVAGYVAMEKFKQGNNTSSHQSSDSARCHKARKSCTLVE